MKGELELVIKTTRSLSTANTPVAPGARLPYGLAKALSEAKVREFFPERHLIVRPSLIVGPGDLTDRFTYWPVRIERGGEILAPGDGIDFVQVIDARDLSEWMIRLVERPVTGIYNALGPRTPWSFAEFLHGIKAATGAYLLAHARDMKDIPTRTGVTPGEGLYFGAGNSVRVTSARFIRAFELACDVRRAGLDARVGAPGLPTGLKVFAAAALPPDDTKWLAGQAEELGVEIYPGMAASEPVFDENGALKGVVAGVFGIAKDGHKKPDYQPGMELHGKYVLIAEGVRGSLAKVLQNRFKLAEKSDPQKFGIGIKELWEVPAEKHKPGAVVHTVSWPLDSKTGGGSFFYHWGDRYVSVGYVVHLNYKNPYLSPFDIFQQHKLHTEIRQHIEGGKRIAVEIFDHTQHACVGGWMVTFAPIKTRT